MVESPVSSALEVTTDVPPEAAFTSDWPPPWVGLSAFGELARGQVTERTVWPLMVVVILPSFQLLAHVVHRYELVDVQELVTQPAVE